MNYDEPPEQPRYSDDPEVRRAIKHAEELVAQEDYYEALELLKLPGASSDPRGLMLGGICLLKTDQPGGMKTLMYAFRRGELESYMVLADHLQSEGKSEEAYALRYNAFEAGYADASVNVAVWFWNNERFKEGLKILDRGVELGSNLARGERAEWRLALGIGTKRKRGRKAIEEDLIAALPVQRTAWRNLALLYEETRRQEQARMVYLEGIEKGYTELYMEYGNFLFRHDEDLDEAAKAYKLGIAAGHTKCHHNLAIVYMRQGHDEEGMREARIGAEAGDEPAIRLLRILIIDAQED